MITNEVLKSFTLAQSSQEVSQLMDENPGLDEYFVPMISLLKALQLLMTGQIDSGRHAGVTIELSPTLDDRVEARVKDARQSRVTEYIPILLSIAQHAAIDFLNEKGYRLLDIIAEGQPTEEKRNECRLYRDALRMCLDRGENDENLLERATEREEEEGLHPIIKHVQDSYLMRDLLEAETTEVQAEWVKANPWMEAYISAFPIHYDAAQMRIRRGLAQVCWGTSWHIRRRALKATPELLDTPAREMLERIREIADRESKEPSVHHQISECVAQCMSLLERCKKEDFEEVILQNASTWVVGVV